MANVKVPVLPVDEGLSSYLREVWKYPVLKPEEEFMLATRWREHEDTDAAHRLVTSHLRLVAKIASGYRGYGLPMSDLVSEGTVGLMRAVKKFEPERGFRLATYAMWWIRAAITEYILKSWSIVKMGTLTAQKKLFFSLRRIKRELDIVDSGELSPEQAAELAEALDVSEGDVIDANRRLSARDLSLNAPVGRDGDSDLEFQDGLVDEGPSPEAWAAEREEATHRRSLMHEALAQLPERERHILTERRLAESPRTLEELGTDYGISRERVRQLENRAFEKLQRAVLALERAAAAPAEA